jgi:hypothetical protein
MADTVVVLKFQPSLGCHGTPQCMTQLLTTVCLRHLLRLHATLQQTQNQSVVITARAYQQVPPHTLVIAWIIGAVMIVVNLHHVNQAHAIITALAWRMVISLTAFAPTVIMVKRVMIHHAVPTHVERGHVPKQQPDTIVTVRELTTSGQTVYTQIVKTLIVVVTGNPFYCSIGSVNVSVTKVTLVASVKTKPQPKSAIHVHWTVTVQKLVKRAMFHLECAHAIIQQAISKTNFYLLPLTENVSDLFLIVQLTQTVYIIRHVTVVSVIALLVQVTCA